MTPLQTAAWNALNRQVTKPENMLHYLNIRDMCLKSVCTAQEQNMLQQFVDMTNAQRKTAIYTQDRIIMQCSHQYELHKRVIPPPKKK
jgi:hypothetical protein